MDLGLHLLIVADDAATRDALTRVLELEGYRVAAAADGRQALASLRPDEPPCLILMGCAISGAAEGKKRRGALFRSGSFPGRQHLNPKGECHGF